MGAGQRGTTARSSGDAAAQSEIFPEKEKIVEPNGEKAGTHGGEKQGENLGTHSERHARAVRGAWSLEQEEESAGSLRVPSS